MDELGNAAKPRKRDLFKAKLSSAVDHIKGVGNHGDGKKPLYRRMCGSKPEMDQYIAPQAQQGGSSTSTEGAIAAPPTVYDTFVKEWARVDVLKFPGEPYPDCRVAIFKNPPNDADLQEILAFVDKFMRSDDAANGFICSYDAVSYSGIPRMSLVWAVANWSAEPERRNLLEERAVDARAAIPAGYMFKFAKMACAAVFRVIPPACNVIMTTDFEDPNAERIVWEAPNPRGAAAKAMGLVEGSPSEASSAPSAKKASSRSLLSANTGPKEATPGCFSQCGGGVLYLCGGRGRRELEDQVKKLKSQNKELSARLKKLEESVAVINNNGSNPINKGPSGATTA